MDCEELIEFFERSFTDLSKVINESVSELSVSEELTCD